MMRALFDRLLPCIFLFGLTAGCGDDSGGGTDPVGGSSLSPDDVIAARELPAELAGDVAELARSNNEFALALFAELGSSDGNLFYSPFSISTALAMTYAGAVGETAREMAASMRFPEDQSAMHPAYGAILGSLDRGSALEGYLLRPANRLWGQAGYHFESDFLEVTATHYDAGFESVDFAGDPESQRVTINEWVEEQTEEKIKNLLPESPPVITSSTKLVLTNAIYFKGNWLLPFDEDETRDMDFHRADDDVVSVPIMYQHGEFRWAMLDDAVVLELPYDGEDLSMFLLIPRELGGLSALEQQLTLDYFEGALAALETSEIDLFLPKFRLETSSMLKESLEAMGMTRAFTPSADFSGITGSPELWIGAVVHKGFVEVNEKGSEAAAATAVIMTDSVGPMFFGNHPFLFFIRDHVTGSILFAGRLADPS